MVDYMVDEALLAYLEGQLQRRQAEPDEDDQAADLTAPATSVGLQ
ncbi:MAG: hypothetical protein R2867_37095 [Caldilineaceae bacterium]